MPDPDDRRIGSALGVVGALLIVLDGFLDLVRGVFYLAIGHGGRAFGPFDQALVFIVVGILAGAFAAFGASRRSDRALMVGVVLIVLAIVGWLALGFGSGVLALLGDVLLLIGGVVFLVAAR